MAPLPRNLRRKISAGIGSRTPLPEQEQRTHERHREHRVSFTPDAEIDREIRMESKRLKLPISRIVALAWRLSHYPKV